MTTTINGKTPDEIKKGLEYCASAVAPCESCPFVTGTDAECIQHMSECALAYIQQLEAAIPKWINVKDRLPEVPKNYNWIEVLCLWKIPEINYVSYRVMRYYGEHKALSFPTGWSLHGDPLDRVTDWSNAMSHWMPLPEPPKEDA